MSRVATSGAEPQRCFHIQLSHLITQPSGQGVPLCRNKHPLKVQVIFRNTRDISPLGRPICSIKAHRSAQRSLSFALTHILASNLSTNSHPPHLYITMGIFSHDSEEYSAYNEVGPSENIAYCIVVEPL